MGLDKAPAAVKHESVEKAETLDVLAEQLLREYPDAPELLKSATERHLREIKEAGLIDGEGKPVNAEHHLVFERSGENYWTLGVKEGDTWISLVYTFGADPASA